MPRNGSGSYSLPQPPFVPNTVISSSAVNSDLNDIASALTGSVSADGQTPITGVLKSSVSGAPAYASSSDSTSGFASASAEADIYVSGSKVLTATPGTISVSNSLIVAGSLSAASQNFSGTGEVGLPAGTTVQRPATPIAGGTRFNTTNNNLEVFDGVEWQAASSFNTAYTITASVGSSLLTVNVLNAVTGVAPTVVDPIVIRFRDATLGTGDQVPVLVSSALTINTNGVGASLGSSNSTPFRFWVVAFNNGGAAVLGLINCSTATQIFPLTENTLHSSIAISAAATSAGVYYTPNGTTVTNAPIKILGYVDYSAGLGTAGTYTTTPSTIQIFGSGIKKPGDIVQTVYGNTSTPVSTSSVSFSASNVTASLAPTTTINPALVNASCYMQLGAASDVISNIVLRRGTSTNIGQSGNFGATGIANGLTGFVTLSALDVLGTTSSTAYTMYFNSSGAGACAVEAGTIIVQELMG